MNRQLPYSEEAERGVLGSVLIEPERVLAVLSENKITENSFYFPAHRILYEFICEMYIESKKIELITVGETLKTAGRIDQVGGYAFLEGLIDSTPTSLHAEYYAEIVSEKELLRKIITQSEEIIDCCYGNTPAKEILSKLQSDSLSLSSINSNEVPLADHCEQFIENSRNGKVGHLPQFCNEWTHILGKLSNEIVFLSAPRSTGKTSLAIQWVRSLHKQGYKAPFLSLESTKSSIAPRFIAQEGQINTWNMRRGATPSFHPDYKSAEEATARLREMKLIVRDGDMAIEAIHSFAKMQKSSGADAIFIDNLLCIGSLKQFENRTQMYIYFLDKIRTIRNDINIPIIVLAHPNEDGKIAWARDVENLADIIMFLCNVSEVKKDSRLWKASGLQDRYLGENHEHCFVKFQKNRDGMTPRLELDFDKEIQTFYPIED